MNILDSFWHLDIKIECLHSEGFVGHVSCIERHKTLDIRFSMGKVRGSGDADECFQKAERAFIRWRIAEGRKLKTVLRERFLMELRLQASSDL